MTVRIGSGEFQGEEAIKAFEREAQASAALWAKILEEEGQRVEETKGRGPKEGESLEVVETPDGFGGTVKRLIQRFRPKSNF